MIAAVAFCLFIGASLDGDPQFQEALRLYKSLEYEQAILRLQEIAVRPDLPKPDKAQSLLWLGLSYAGTADFDSARRYLKSALENDASVALPPDQAPRIEALFHDLQREVAAAKPPPPPPAPAPPRAPTTSKSADARGGGIVVGGVVGALGVLALAGAAACGVLASQSYADATKPGQFQDVASADVDATNSEIVAAAILAPVGVVGGWLLLSE